MRLFVLCVLIALLPNAVVAQHGKEGSTKQAGQNQKPAQSKNQAPTVVVQSQTNQPPATQEPGANEKPRDRFLEHLTAWSTLAIAVVTGVYAFISYCMVRKIGQQVVIAGVAARAARSAANATQASVGMFMSKERARLRVDFQFLIPATKDFILSVRVNVALVGNSQAEILDFSCRCTTSLEDDPLQASDWDSVYELENLPRFITPENREVCIKRRSRPSPRFKDMNGQDLLALVENGDAEIFCVGSILYKDIFEQRWLRNFSRKWTYKSLAGVLGGIGQWIDCGSPEDNEEKQVT